MTEDISPGFSFGGSTMRHFLQESRHIDFSAPIVAGKAHMLFSGISGDIEKARVAFEFVRDEIPHSF
ncbi:MAG: hypothetical protein LBL95_00365, partial [Deltaproteobacteria bacterium]|nr:hypothetical protein [Deltaproteobacteria bacterium]